MHRAEERLTSRRDGASESHTLRGKSGRVECRKKRDIVGEKKKKGNETRARRPPVEGRGGEEGLLENYSDMKLIARRIASKEPI